MRQLKEIIEDSVHVKQLMLADPEILDTIAQAAAALTESLRDGHRALFCGNGGSAADAQHFAAELSGRYLIERPPLNAEALHANSSFLTAVANDYSYDEVYARAVHAFGASGDVLVALSTSGNSPNVVRAASEARDLGMLVIGLTGEGGGDLKEFCSYLIAVPSRVTAHIQEAHITVAHAISELVERELFGGEVRD